VNLLLGALLVFLVANMLAGIVLVFRSRIGTPLLAAQLFGSLGVGVLLVLAQLMGEPALRDVALLFALLGGMAAMAFSTRRWSAGRRTDSDPGNVPGTAAGAGSDEHSGTLS
jgi:multicomponent Na+:H+ antiporter subunit F